MAARMMRSSFSARLIEVFRTSWPRAGTRIFQDDAALSEERKRVRLLGASCALEYLARSPCSPRNREAEHP